MAILFHLTLRWRVGERLEKADKERSNNKLIQIEAKIRLLKTPEGLNKHEDMPGHSITCRQGKAKNLENI